MLSKQGKKKKKGFSLCLCFKNGTRSCEIIEQKNIILLPLFLVLPKVINSFQMYEPEVYKENEQYKNFCYYRSSEVSASKRSIMVFW